MSKEEAMEKWNADEFGLEDKEDKEDKKEQTVNWDGWDVSTGWGFDDEEEKKDFSKEERKKNGKNNGRKSPKEEEKDSKEEISTKTTEDKIDVRFDALKLDDSDESSEEDQ
eukprot:CAMPEP_0168324250 /NCGR_PEP_ID=MMETSP0213-20121227/3974_1 /TAXON_ID=151035 /ORGANISM="Euplotes harpa, Strain FSP1.4" /LENGTH=110 /DNA_ID=CAMNT_0008326495 /DNA_START=297 /DNA_END=629 /DNA_ORIENTATION=+